MDRLLVQSIVFLFGFYFIQNVACDDYRLPKHIIPRKYEVQLETKLDPSFEFEGSVLINIEVLKSTNHIILNSYKLDYSAKNIIVKDAYGEEVKVTLANLIDNYQILQIYVQDDLQKNHNYTIEIKGFKAKLRDDMSGFYRSSYKTPNGDTRWLATTQFQATHARSAFPCFDEPAFKAKFEITLIHHESLTAISNMPTMGPPVKLSQNRLRTHFRESVVMSTYLVAFIISDFEYKELWTVPVKYRVFSQPYSVNQTQYALEMTPKIVTALEALTGVNYKLDKMDQVGIPDFAAGAMENWGLLTYREMYLLYDKGESTSKSKEEILTIIAHEITHQWFGNLVTCDWWEHTWLNEGFARYFQHYIPSLIEPTWRLLDRYVIEVTQGVLNRDSLATTRPMSYPVSTPSEISAVFDSISYDKASSVIHMMMHAFDISKFVEGLHKYLTENSYKTAVPMTLFDALASKHNGATEIPKDTTLQEVFLSWSSQPGFPLVTVTRDYSTGSMTLKQERYFTVHPEEEDNTAWWIPINYMTSDNLNANDTRPTHWMSSDGKPLVIDAKQKEGFVILNIQNSGYYRVNYDQKNWKELANVLKSPKYEEINVLNRAQILDDSLNLAKNGRIEYSLALDILDYLHQETDYVPWRAADEDLKFLNNMLDGTAVYDKFKNFVLHIVNKVYNKMGFEEQAHEHMDVFNRINALSWACKMDHKDCLQKSQDRLTSIMTNSSAKIPPNLHNVVYCTALKHGGKTEWDFLWKKYLNSHLSSEGIILLNALGCSRDENILNDYLEKTIEKNSKIRDQDKFRVVHSVISQGNYGMMTALKFMERSLPQMIEQYTSLNALKKVFEIAGAAVSNNEEYDLLHKIFEKYEDLFSDSLKLGAQTAKETMDDNKAWRNKNLAKVIEWFENYVEHNHNSSSKSTINSLVIMLIIINTIFVFNY